MRELIIRNAKVWTVDAEDTVAEAIAIAGETIRAVGTNEQVQAQAGADAETIDAEGRLIVPGFNDAHLHMLMGGASLMEPDLRPSRNEQDLVRRLVEHVATVPSGQWISGGNWDHESWPSKRPPTRDMIDPVTPENPTLIRRLDGHIALANSLALKLAGISAETPDPQGGKIARDPATGEPTGILIDTAIYLVTKHRPPASDEQNRRALLAAMEHAAAMGVTSASCMSVSLEELRLLQQLRQEGRLTVRCHLALLADAWDALGAGPPADDWLQPIGQKVFSDGSFGAGSAWCFDPYEDNPGFTGLAIYEPEELVEIVRQADSAGRQLCIHAIGDRAVHECLNAIEQAIAANGRRDARHRIEHVQMVQPDDRPRFARLGVIASIESSHCTDDMRWIQQRLGDRAQYAHPYASLLAAGAMVCQGTDWFVEPLDPMVGLYSAVTRELPAGGPDGGWYPAERVTMAQAIRDYTLTTAYAQFAERRKGSIEPGKLADLVMLSGDVTEPDGRAILAAKPVMTIVGGRVVYRG